MLINGKQASKAGVLFRLIGEHLPKNVLDKLQKSELEKLLNSVKNSESISSWEIEKVLTRFNSELKDQAYSSNSHELEMKLEKELKEILKETSVSFISDLKFKKRDHLSRLVKDEEASVVALVISFADPNEASGVLEEFPDHKKEEILYEIQKIDFHSESEKDKLERFLRFKTELIKSNKELSRVKSRGSKKAAEILSKISPNIARRLFSSIREKSPDFANRIDQHFYTLEDLTYLSRTALMEFMSGFHPIIIACSFKGIEAGLKDKLLERSEPWFAKQVRMEMDTMGPISLAEIEEAQKAIINRLHEAIEDGSIKLWKVS